MQSNGCGSRVEPNPTKANIQFFAGKALRLATLLVAVALLSFALIELSPIDPVTAYVGTSTKVSAEQRAEIAEHWGLYDPPEDRFFTWAKNMAQGDWGDSNIYRRPVLEVIGDKFVASLALMASAWLLSGIIGYVLGVAAGLKTGSLFDKAVNAYCHVLISTPTFWLGILFISLFAVKLGWLPVGLSVPIGVLASEVSFVDRIAHMILPTLTLAVIGIAPMCLHTREKTIEVMDSDYVLFARARGESTASIVEHHVIRNVSLPAITLQFLSFSELFGGAVFVEQVFSYPGLGNATVQAGLKGDVPLLMGIAIFSLLFVFTGNTTADVLYRILDPRISNEVKAS